MCNVETDSNVHTLRQCTSVCDLLDQVYQWIQNNTNAERHPTDIRKCAGNVGNNCIFNNIILATKNNNTYLSAKQKKNS